LDYTSNQAKPINYGIVTQSISASQVPGYDNNAAFNNPNIPYAELQDSNYALQSFTIPRYYGSKTISATYNDYTIGDSSYGSTAAIDKIKYQYAYLVDMYSSSFQLPGRVNAQIKYIIDNNQNVLDLTKANKNVFSVQNIFKSGENTNISLFNYSPNSAIAQYLTNNQNVDLYEGGFRYSPILYSVNGLSNDKVYSLNYPSSSTSTINSGNVYNYLLPTDGGYWSTPTVTPTSYPGAILLTFNFASKIFNTGSFDTEIALSITNLSRYTGNPSLDEFSYSVSIADGQSAPASRTVYVPSYYADDAGWTASDIYQVSVNSERYISGNSTTSLSQYFTAITDFDSRWYAVDRRTIRISATQSLFYNNFIQSSTSPGIETPVNTFTLNQQDLIRLKNSGSSWGLLNESEYRVNGLTYATYTNQSSSLAGNVPFYDFTLDRDLNPGDTDTGIPGRITNYIVLKRDDDETNLIFAFSGSSNITDDGLIFPKYIDPIVRENSGNVIKSLKQQNLI